MTEELAALGKVMESMRAPIRNYVESVRALAGENAISLTLIGAIAYGTFDRSRHTARSVLVLKRVDLEMLRRLSEQGPKFGKARIAAPLIMTPEYIGDSRDTFPLEFIEIVQCHVTLFGVDYFQDVPVDAGHVRLQCERELKTVLMGMRQGLLASTGKEKVMGAIEVDVAERLIRIARGMLWLKGQKEPRPALDVVASIEKLTGTSLPGIHTTLSLTERHGWEAFQSLYHDVTTLGNIVNDW